MADISHRRRQPEGAGDRRRRAAQGERPPRGRHGRARRSRRQGAAARQGRGPRDPASRSAGRGLVQVAQATIRQREADLKFAADQPRSLAQPVRAPAAAPPDARRRRGAPPVAQRAARSGARRSSTQAKARLDELQHHARATPRSSRRSTASSASATLDPGAFGRSNTAGRCRSSTSLACGWSPTSSRRTCGASASASGADVEVDAFPGENFHGRVARVAPVLDPATRTARDGNRGPERRLPPEARACTRACS